MFGYVLISKDGLSPAEFDRYRGCYCGLCRALKQRYGNFSRLTLNYDMTFLVLLLSAMYEPEETGETFRCVRHPVSRRQCWRSAVTDYAADMNVVLAYFNCLDNWKDDKNPAALAETRFLNSAREKAASLWPRQYAAIEGCLRELAEIESDPAGLPDAAANCFGSLMGELFIYREDRWAEVFRAFGEGLGRFIYWLDAAVDEKKDARRGRYNPFLRAGQNAFSQEEKERLLTVLIAECAAEFEKLPVVQDAGLLRNILYSGVWTRSRYQQNPQEGRTDGQRPL